MKITENQVQKASERYFRDCGYQVYPSYRIASGDIDLYFITDKGKSVILEIKEAMQVKRAIGQILTYKNELPTDEQHILLFSYKYPKNCTDAHLNLYKKSCKDMNIILKHIEETPIINYLWQ